VITVIFKLPVVNIITNSMAELETNEHLIMELFRKPKKAYKLLLALHLPRKDTANKKKISKFIPLIANLGS